MLKKINCVGIILTVLLTCCFINAVYAQESSLPREKPRIILGKHYDKFTKEIQSKPEIKQLRLESKECNKTKVIMFFSYGCYWCGQLYDPFLKWQQDLNKDIDLEFIPVTFTKSWERLAKAYYTIRALNLDAVTLDKAIFDGIHKEKRHLGLVKEIKTLFLEHGVTEADFNKYFNSFSTDNELKRARGLLTAYEVLATPFIVINTENDIYYTNWAMAGTLNRLFAILDLLI